MQKGQGSVISNTSRSARALRVPFGAEKWNSFLLTPDEEARGAHDQGRDESPEWLLVGSAASVLQGVPFEPNDLDIITRTEGHLQAIATRMQDVFPDRCDLPVREPGWLSSRTLPVMQDTFDSGFTWSKARWRAQGFPVEAVFMPSNFGIPDAPDGSGLWEGGRRHVWDHRRLVRFHGYEIPVAPLEIQVESNYRRGVEWKVAAIRQTLRTRGCDEALLRIALSHPNYERFAADR